VRLTAAVGADSREAEAGAVEDGESLHAAGRVRCGDADVAPDGDCGADKEACGVAEGEPLARLEGLPVAEVEGLPLPRGVCVAASTEAVAEGDAPLVAVPAGVEDSDAGGLRVCSSALPLAATEAEAVGVDAAQREGRGEVVPLCEPGFAVCVAAWAEDGLTDEDAKEEKERAALRDVVASAEAVGVAESEAEPLVEGGEEGLPAREPLPRALPVRAADAEPGGGVAVVERPPDAEGVPAPVWEAHADADAGPDALRERAGEREPEGVSLGDVQKVRVRAGDGEELPQADAEGLAEGELVRVGEGKPVREALCEPLSLAGEGEGVVEGEPARNEREAPGDAVKKGEPDPAGVPVSLGGPLAAPSPLCVRGADGEPEVEAEGPPAVGLAEQDAEAVPDATPVGVPQGDAVRLPVGESLGAPEPGGERVAVAVAQGDEEGEKTAEAENNIEPD
jgi:hypothetical protein